MKDPHFVFMANPVKSLLWYGAKALPPGFRSARHRSMGQPGRRALIPWKPLNGTG